MSADTRPLAGRIALVTGSSSGIGRAIAIELASDGAALALVDIDDGSRVVAEIEALGGHAVAFRADVSSPPDVDRLRDEVVGLLGAPGILVNNAGIFPVVAWEDLDFELWRRVMSVNLDGTFLMCKAFAPAMSAAGWGRIINLASSSVGTGVTHFTHYIASKMGIIGLTRALASELGPDSVTVNAVAPSLVRTPSTIDRETGPGGLTSDQEFAALIEVQSVKRSSEPEDISGVVAFLASERAGFMTGQTLFADGGVVRAG